MKTKLHNDIVRRIREHGPMDVGTFMDLAVSHYYATRDPFGDHGDFTTAPEISQMFGEMIGAWVADCWLKMGAPNPFMLIECGPGRGTLMADILRATKSVPDFHAALSVHLLETSPILRKKQKAALSSYDCTWHDDLSSVPEDCPFVLIGNEFLDALPIRQMQKAGEEWKERRITVNDDGELSFLPEGDGDVREYSTAQEVFMNALCSRIKNQKGTALLIDYGYVENGFGDSLQAVKGHKPLSVFEHVGDADLTAHVNFAALGDIINKNGCIAHGPVPQGLFLKALGIDLRAVMLQQKANEEHIKEIQSSLERLCAMDDPRSMGALFKVVAVTDEKREVAGF